MTERKDYHTAIYQPIKVTKVDDNQDRTDSSPVLENMPHDCYPAGQYDRGNREGTSFYVVA